MNNRKKIIYSASIVLASLVITSCSEKTKVEPKMSACEILNNNPSWGKSLKKAENSYKLPPAFAMGVMYQESRFKSDAKAVGSSAYGYAQAIDSTWKHFQEDVKANAKRDNFNDSIQFMGWYMAQLAKSAKLKMTESENLYMAYMLGATGFKRYKAGTFKNKAKLVEDKKLAEKVKNFTKLYKSQLKKCKI